MKIYCNLDRPVRALTAVGIDGLCWKWFAGQEDGSFMTQAKTPDELISVCRMLEKVGATNIEIEDEVNESREE